MDAFFNALIHHEFMRNALMAGLLASVGCGVVGSYVVVKRIGFLAGGIAHTALGGMGVAFYFGTSPLVGALVAAVVAAILIGWVTLKWREREDTLIGALWAIGMAIGVLFISKTPGYNVDLMSYLFGNILMVTRDELWLMAALDAMLLALAGLFFKQLLAVSFDEEFARLRGVPVTFFYLLLLGMVAVTVVLLIRVVGLILVIALLTLPAAIAGHYIHTLGRIMGIATLLGMVFSSGGLALAYGPDLPVGAVIILLAGGAYMLSAASREWRRRRRTRRLARRSGIDSVSGGA